MIVEIEKKFRTKLSASEFFCEVIPPTAAYKRIRNTDYYYYKPGLNHFLRYREDYGNNPNPVITFKEEKEDTFVRMEINLIPDLSENTSNLAAVRGLANTILGYNISFTLTKESIMFRQDDLEVSFYLVWAPYSDFGGQFIEIEYRGDAGETIGKQKVKQYADELKERFPESLEEVNKSLFKLYLENSYV